jgi:hypothetical protein
MIKLSKPVCPAPVPLKTNYKHPSNKDALRRASFDKCMYCESKISHTYYGDVEHIKPKSAFPELEFEWDNLGYICAQCNGEKSNKFDASCPFINPYDEVPSDHLVALGPYLRHTGGSERGELTIREVGLNRTALVEKRLERMTAIANLIDKIHKTKNATLKALIIAELEEEKNTSQEYSMVISQCVDILLPNSR